MPQAVAGKTAVLGLGLLGGSLMLALKRRNLCAVGWDPSADARRRAAKKTRVVSSLKEAVKGARVVVAAAPPRGIPALLKEAAVSADPAALFLDVASVKAPLMKALQEDFDVRRRFVPCHPLAGGEQSGFSAARAELFSGCVVFLTPFSGTAGAVLSRAESFWRILGAKCLHINAQEHDRWMAKVSHLPHVTAAALMVFLKQGNKKPVGAGFKDATRMAAGNPSLWREILSLNAREVEKTLRFFRSELESYEKLIKKKQWAKLERKLSRAARARRNLS